MDSKQVLGKQFEKVIIDLNAETITANSRGPQIMGSDPKLGRECFEPRSTSSTMGHKSFEPRST